jgi:hypothetical protein
MQFLTPEMIGRIAAALGLDRTMVQSAINAVVPALLAAFGGAATQPGGAQKLADAARQQTGALGNFASMLGGGHASMIDKGTQMLSSLIGGRDQTALAGAVDKFTGLGQGASSSLLGMLAPVVLGTIGQQQEARSLDAGGIASLLASQKDNIAAALPSGFGNLLAGTGLLDSLGGAARTAAEAGSQAARTATSAARAASDAGQRAASRAAASTNWLYWLIPLIAIAALLFYWFGRPTEKAVQQVPPPAPSLTVSGVDLGRQVTDSISTLRNALAGVTDAASARAALPRLQEVTTQIDRVSSLRGQLSAEQQRSLAGMVNPLMAALNQLFDKVLAIPGVAEVLKPTIDALKAKLTALAA